MARTSARGRTVLMVFAGGFCLVFGLLLLVMAWELWRPYSRSASWDQASATLLSAELGQRSRSHSRGSSTFSWEVKCRYRFELDGRPVPGTRVAVGSPSWGLRGEAEERLATLQTHLRDGTPIRVWVNPDDPSESALFRELHPYFPYCVAFAGPLTLLGLCLTVGPLARLAFTAIRDRRRRRW